MTIETVDVDAISTNGNARQIVGEGRTQARADFDDARLAEGRMQRIGRTEQFKRGAHTDAAILTLDRGRADQEAVARAWNDIKRPSRMNDTNGSLQMNFGCLDRDGLALHAA